MCMRLLSFHRSTAIDCYVSKRLVTDQGPTKALWLTGLTSRDYPRAGKADLSRTWKYEPQWSFVTRSEPADGLRCPAYPDAARSSSSFQDEAVIT